MGEYISVYEVKGALCGRGETSIISIMGAGDEEGGGGVVTYSRSKSIQGSWAPAGRQVRLEVLDWLTTSFNRINHICRREESSPGGREAWAIARRAWLANDSPSTPQEGRKGEEGRGTQQLLTSHR